jgi:surfeit locus 1 family protein
MISSLTTLSAQKPTDWVSGDLLPKQYQSITVKGYFLMDKILLDNQHYQHQFGYDVISPLVLSSGQIVLVDRGWIIKSRGVSGVDVPSGMVNLTGSAYYPSDKNWLLGQAVEKHEDGLLVLELLDIKLVGHILNKSVYPFVIRLARDEPNGYTREWAVVAMNPQRHYGYAFQWFAIGLVIFIIFVALNLKISSENQ